MPLPTHSDVYWEDFGYDVGRAVGIHPNAPLSILEHISMDNDDDLHEAAPLNPKCPRSLLEDMAGETSFPRAQMAARKALGD